MVNKKTFKLRPLGLATALVIAASVTLLLSGSLTHAATSPDRLEACTPGPVAPAPRGAVYQATCQWTEKEEELFSAWVERNVDVGLMERLKIPTDCGKMPVAVRLIYARVRSLPSVVLSGGGAISQASTTWAQDSTVSGPWGANWEDSYRQDVRFQKFLLRALSGISTRTLPAHTYPVRLSDKLDERKLSRWIRPGIIAQDEGHVRLVRSVHRDSAFPIEEIQSTVPEIVRPLALTPFTLAHYPVERTQGLRAWLWSGYQSGQWRLLPPQAKGNDSGLDDEQFKLPNAPKEDTEKELQANATKARELEAERAALKYEARTAHVIFQEGQIAGDLEKLQNRRKALERTLALYRADPSVKFKGTFSAYIRGLAGGRPPTPDELDQFVATLARTLETRRKLVDDAQPNRETRFRDPKSAEFDQYSTFNRDRAAVFIHAQTMASLRGEDSTGEAANQFALALRRRKIEVLPGKIIDLAYWYEALGHGYVSSHPQSPPEHRWGLHYAARLVEMRFRLQTDLMRVPRELQRTERDIGLVQRFLETASPATDPVLRNRYRESYARLIAEFEKWKAESVTLPAKALQVAWLLEVCQYGIVYCAP